MKILTLKILSPDGEIIRDVRFKEKGLTLIYGDIKFPENKKTTINSLGKTLFLKMLDYILGADSDPKVMKKELKDFTLLSEVKYKSKIYIVKRIIGVDIKEAIFVDDKPKSLLEYKEMFDINRQFLDKQVILTRKNSEVSSREHASKDDYTSLLNLLSLNELGVTVSAIYDLQNQLKKLKLDSKEAARSFADILQENETLEEKIFIIDKTVEQLQNNLSTISSQVSNINTASLKSSNIKEYEFKNIEFKKLRQLIEQLEIEKKRLIKYIEEVDSGEITNTELVKIFNKAKIELPDMVVKKIQEVEAFHKNVITERKETIEHNINELSENINSKNKIIEKLSSELDTLGKLLSENRAYQESIQLYGNYNLKLQELLFQQGQLSQVKEINDSIVEVDGNLSEAFINAKISLKSEFVTNEIQKYRDFVYDLVKQIYNEDVISFFELNIKEAHRSRRPVEFKLSMQGETGEGITEVKKNIIDYLVFNFNTTVEILIQDSSCYNGIDPRQVSNMLMELNIISNSNNKQSIVAINKYQLDSDKTHTIFNVFDKKFGINLSENNKLLKMDF